MAILYFFWIIPNLLLAMIAFVVFRLKLHRQFAAFFAYCIWASTACFVLFALIQTRSTPVAFYIASNLWFAGSVCLRSAIVYEVLACLVPLSPSRAQSMKSLFRWAAVLVMLIAIGIAAYQNGLNQGLDLVVATALRSMGVVFDISQCGLLLFLLLSWWRLQFCRKDFAFGLALGMGSSLA